MNLVTLFASIASIICAVVAVYSVFQLRHGVQRSFTLDMTRLINRIERNREPFKQTNPAAYKELFDFEDGLETTSKKFLSVFNFK